MGNDFVLFYGTNSKNIFWDLANFEMTVYIAYFFSVDSIDMESFSLDFAFVKLTKPPFLTIIIGENGSFWI